MKVRTGYAGQDMITFKGPFRVKGASDNWVELEASQKYNRRRLALYQTGGTLLGNMSEKKVNEGCSGVVLMSGKDCWGRSERLHEEERGDGEGRGTLGCGE